MTLEKMRPASASFACTRRVPLSLLLLDNVPTVILYILGAAVFFEAGPLWGSLFAVYAVASLVWFWARICPACHHYNTAACPCGYGMISARLFKRKPGGDFRKTFRRNIVFLFPLWFLPPALATYLLISSFSVALLAELIAFCVIGFAVIPLVSKLVGCRNCAVKADCPWMSKGC
jgi:hypothetical protein